jgi:hypothetical protein
MGDALHPSMNWKLLTERLMRTVSRPEYALLIELASAALLLGWIVHWAAE